MKCDFKTLQYNAEGRVVMVSAARCHAWPGVNVQSMPMFTYEWHINIQFFEIYWFMFFACAMLIFRMWMTSFDVNIIWSCVWYMIYDMQYLCLVDINVVLNSVHFTCAVCLLFKWSVRTDTRMGPDDGTRLNQVQACIVSNQ